MRRPTRSPAAARRARGPLAETALAEPDPHGDLWQRDPDAAICARPRRWTGAGRFDGWITGGKRFQGGWRWRLTTLEPECSRGRIKINPLALWSADDVERYRELRQPAKRPFADRGYRSIGGVPCTRPVPPQEPQRAGRWWGLDRHA